MRSRIGPLALEGRLGVSSSKVFRALHTQQKAQVAVRLFSVPMGLTPEAKRDFAEQTDALKLLRHDHIVRCYGGGFDSRDAYLVYEIVEGESLDVILERRGRLPWETMLSYGLQICDALEYAHALGWVHGRIRPDKLLTTLGESVAKLSDFRRDLNASNWMTQAPTLRELAYSPPDSFGDGYRPSPASDLYGLGATLYHGLTGELPFTSENRSQLRDKIIETAPEPVAAKVYDCPVWLSSIVQTLLDKSPERRFYSAAAASMAFKTAQQRAMEGASVIEHAVSGFSPLQMGTDKDEAARVLGYKKERKRPESNANATPWTDKSWVLILGIATAIGAIYYLTRPLSENTLYQRAAALITKDDSISFDEARQSYLNPLIERFPDGPHAAWATEQIEMIDMYDAERKMERNRRFNRQPDSEGERKYEEAMRYERFGDRVTALERYKAIVNLLKDVEEERPFVNLSRRAATRLEEESPSVEELKLFLTSKLDEADKQLENGDILAPKATWESIIKLYNGNKEMLEIVKRAQSRINKFSEEP